MKVHTTKFLLILITVVSTNAKGTNVNNVISLQDGRILGYAEYGQLDGFPVFYFHGGQESRLSSAFMDSTAKELGIRIISPDRPGIGLSSFQENRTFLNWGDDMSELADSLGLKTFSVFGLSGGAPHVISCLIDHPNRIINASIVSGATPYDYKKTLKGMWFPVKVLHWLANMKTDKKLRKYILKDFKGLRDNPEKRMKQFQKYLPKPDKNLMNKHPEYGWEFIEGSKESYKQGIDGVVQEWQLYVKNWGMNLNHIEHPVTLWYGSEDKMAPVHRGEYYNNKLLNSDLKVVNNEAHFSLIRNHLTDILKDLIQK
jgi:pimeloyl-ACP methyl ester carboxylesterase